MPRKLPAVRAQIILCVGRHRGHLPPVSRSGAELVLTTIAYSCGYCIHPRKLAIIMIRSVLLLSISAVCMPETVAAERPNVLLIIADDQGWTDFGFMGHEVIRTPRLDRLMGESAVFPNGYVPTSLCRASLATLLTGLYAHQHLICCNDPPDGMDRSAMHPFIQKTPTLPRLLKDAGYRCLQTGKFW